MLKNELAKNIAIKQNAQKNQNKNENDIEDNYTSWKVLEF